MKTKWIAIITFSLLVTFAGVSVGGEIQNSPSYNTHRTGTARQLAMEDQIYAEIYSRAASHRIKNRSTGEYILNQALPYQNTRQLRNEIKSGVYQTMTGAYSWDSHKDTLKQRYRSRGADLGPALANRLYGNKRGENPYVDLGVEIATDAWNTQVMPRIFNLK